LDSRIRLGHGGPFVVDLVCDRLVWHLRFIAGGLVLLVAVLSGCATGGSSVPPGHPTTPYVVGPPDSLTVVILPDPVITRSVVVRPDGKISIDLVGDVQAGGRTTMEIAQDIRERISRYKRDSVVTVSVNQSLSNSITVLGEVRGPGTFPIGRDMRLIEAIGSVGGTTQFVSNSGIRVIRIEGDRTVVYKINLSDIKRGNFETNIAVLGGDVIIAPPNTLAKVGYFLQTILFPFQPVIGAAGIATTAMAF
jgi:polysaccharide export outer membrane protein